MSLIKLISGAAWVLLILFLSGCMATTTQTSKVSNGYNEYSNAPIGCPQSETSKALGEAAELIGLIADALAAWSDPGGWRTDPFDQLSVESDCP